MTSNAKNLAVLFGILIPGGLASYVYLQLAGVTDANLVVLLKLTARISFMIYLLVFIARPLRQLIFSRMTRWLFRERRSLGIAFAAMHTVHLGLIATRFSSLPILERPITGTLVGATAYTLIYLMLLTSFDKPARMIGPKNWRRLHKTGLYFVGFVFVATLLPEPGQPVYTMERAWITVLAGGAVVIRMTAWFAARQKRLNEK